MKYFKPRYLLWVLVLAAGVFSIMFSLIAEEPRLTNSDRVRELASDFACPVCDGQSLAESDVPIARNIRATIAQLVDDGSLDVDIRNLLVSRFGEEIDYNPAGDGLIGLVWVIPVVVGVLAIAGMIQVLFLWRDKNIEKSVNKVSIFSNLNKKRVFWSFLISCLAVVAGFIVSETAGSRGDSDSSSGEIRKSPRTLLIEASVTGPGKAIEIYDEVLEIQPSNVEALAYRGWRHWLVGELELSQIDIGNAILIDPTYPDALAFRAIQSFRKGEASKASGDLIALDALDSPPIINDLIFSSGLRERVSSSLAQAGELILALELLDSGIEANQNSSA